MRDASGNLVIVEAKGGAGWLARTQRGEQMSQRWIDDKVRRVRQSGQTELAHAMEAQMQSGRLKAMVVSTKHDGPNAFVPQVEMKDWNEIGATTW